MKPKPRYAKYTLIAISLIVVMAVLVFFAPVRINTALAEPLPFTHNYITFVDETGEEIGKLVENNGWLLLEAILNRALNKTIEPELAKELERYKDASNPTGLYGWWPDSMHTGKRYFVGKPPIRLAYDIDDAFWGQRYRNKKISDAVLQQFISDEELPIEFAQACTEIACYPSLLIRIWNDVDWHDDLDIVSIANAITFLDQASDLQQRVFQANQALLNHILENKEYEAYYKYYEPKIAGTFLILYYDREGTPFLTPGARTILLEKLQADQEMLLDAPLIARWHGGEDWFYGYNIVTINDDIPKLMYEYTTMHFT